MRNRRQHRIGAACFSLLLLGGAGCDSLLDVPDPDTVTVESVDPLADAETFSRSAYQNFVSAVPLTILYMAWFTNEARVGDTFPTRNAFGRRIIDARSNGDLSGLWGDLSLAVASSEDVLDLLADVEGADTNVNIARAAFSSGYAMLFTADAFCQGTIRGGPALDQNAMLDHAIARLQRARDIGAASGDEEGAAIANAAKVGLARAYLAKGDLTNAASAAADVPDDFVYEMEYSADPGNRGRLGNDLYTFTVARLSLVVGPEWRAIADAGDKRISYGDAGRLAQDGKLHFWTQGKYGNYDAPIRLASGLEARYIEAEASGDINRQLTLINERRSANGLGTFSSSDTAEVLAELMNQKARDFWLEGHRMGDWRRNGDAVPFIIPTGPNYYKPELGEVGDATCWPLPTSETDFNPNF
ncbi:MAG TPA: hypothetical protein VF188_04815 [Longimicrobiales bacterium]